MIGVLPELQVLKWFNLILRQHDNKYYLILLKEIEETVKNQTIWMISKGIFWFLSKKFDGTIIFTSPVSRLHFVFFKELY